MPVGNIITTFLSAFIVIVIFLFLHKYSKRFRKRTDEIKQKSIFNKSLPRCSSCSNVLKKNEAFCSKCGRKTSP